MRPLNHRFGLVFLHGWGYGPETWDALARSLAPAPTALLNAGYFGPPLLSLPDGLPQDPEGWVGVGHSLGFARLLEMGLPVRGLVGIGGFLRFCRQPGKAAGTPADTLDAMLSRLDAAPEDVLARFRRRCGHRGSSLDHLDAHGLARLRADLLRLRGLDLPAPGKRIPTLLIHAQDDRIVPLDLAREALALLPNSRLELLPDGGHALPLTRSADCQRLIQEFLHDLG